MLVALAHASAAGQVPPPDAPAFDASPKCEAAPDAGFQARRIADLGDAWNSPTFVPDYFPGAKRIVLVARDRRAALFDISTGEKLAELNPPTLARPRVVARSPDGEVIVWSDGQSGIEMRRTRTGEMVARPDTLQGDGEMLFSPDGSRLIRIWAGVVNVVDGKTGAPVGVSFDAGVADERGISSDGSRLVLHKKKGVDAVIDLRTGQPAYSIAVAAGEELTFDADGVRAIIAGDQTWKLVDPSGGGELATGPAAGPNKERVDFVGNGAFVLTEGEAGSRIIDARTGRMVARAGKLATESLPFVNEFGLQMSPDRRTAVTRAPDGTARLWDISRGRGLAELGVFADRATEDRKSAAGASDATRRAAPSGEFRFTPDGDRLITQDIAGRFSIWDTRSGRRVATIAQFSNHDRVWFAEDGAFALAITADGTGTLWNTRSGWRIANMGEFSPSPGAIDIRLSSDGGLLLVSDKSRTELWDTERGVRIGQRTKPASLRDAAFSADGAWLILRPNDDEAVFEIWNARTGGRGGEARQADEAEFYKVSGEDVLLTRSAAGFALWDMKRGERAVSCQFSDPGLSMMEIFAVDDALNLVVDAGGGRSELWRLERK
jgi:WD40 repeat protein